MKKDSCPICGKAPSPAQKPFCSQGCRDRDLLQWLGEGYRIPAGPAERDEADSVGADSVGADSMRAQSTPDGLDSREHDD